MALVQADCDTGNLFASTTQYVYTYPTPPTAGNLLILGSVQNTRTVSSAAGTSNTYTINGANTNNASAGYNASQWKVIASGSDTTVTITLSGANGSSDSTICFAEFSGAASDQSGSTANGASNSTTTTHNSGSVTPPTADNVVVSTIYISGGTWTPDGAFTDVTTGQAIAKFAYKLQTAADAEEYNATTNVNRFTAMRVGAFAGASSGSAPGSMLLLMGGQ